MTSIRRLIAAALVFLISSIALSQGEFDEILRVELLEMLRIDQEVRVRIVSAMQTIDFGNPPTEEWMALVEEQNEIDEKNSRRLDEIIERYGWPGRSLVGEDGAQAASIILQHSTLDRQQRYLPILRTAVSHGELEGARLAYLEDRVRMHQGQEQIYGTQISIDGDVLSIHPVMDPQHLDERRSAIGLPPIEQYLQEAEAEIGRPIDRSNLH